ncbi:arabinosylfuranosidase ArfA [Demequina aestuarii]|uniref:arabinosylfuranosidase ArfA n=1 Tax=Demequina aestuarii TaxID=327095 RepID=UPI000780897B|nr:alpha-L-arabinofuranosidase C-terminal domain-containing protein [Demequina aestuarii]
MIDAVVTVPGVTVSDVPARMFGSFVEHMGRCVYTGIFEPGHATANAEGFRGDVLDLVRELGVSVVRYPGGNFVSGYRWEDGIGPVEERPRRLETAWHEIEPNIVGLHEFVTWAEQAGVEIMEAVNLGTRGVEDAMRLVEYSNHPSGTALSDARRRNGAEEPFGIRLWCLGNEMDGPWQLGAKSAEEYGALARETAKGMRAVDPSIELVLAGSSGTDMPTYGEWERTVLRHAYAHVDYLSLHLYVQERQDPSAFLASALRLEQAIRDVSTIIDEVRAEGQHSHQVALAIDEWNVWNQDRFNDPEHQREVQHGPWLEHPEVIEDVYTLTDAVVVGTFLHTMLRNADRVRIANLAQLVNVIAPIMTAEGGDAWRQATFWPFARIASHARGNVLETHVDAPEIAGAPAVDAVVTHEDDRGEWCVFLANRALEDSASVTITLPRADLAAREAEVLTSAEGRLAVNTHESPGTVAMQELPVASGDGVLEVTLPPVSWAWLRVGVPST